MMRQLLAVFTLLILFLPAGAFAQDGADAGAVPDRSATGGAQTLEDIMRRQQGLPVDNSFRSDNIGGDATMAPGLGPLGGASDSEIWRALRFDNADVTTTAGGEVGKVLIQDGGMAWWQFREGPLATYGGYLLLGTIGALVLFYLLRGKIKLDGERTGRTVTRFQLVERFAHWMLAGSFIVLGVTGLLVLFGKILIVPVFGKEANAVLLTYSKLLHNNLAWPFMISLVMVFVMWVWDNLPSRTDIVWFLQGGGIIGNKHPPAKKFNAGQKIIFWSVILLGGSISVSGLSLLFPFELPLFAKTFEALNSIGVPALIGWEAFPIQLSPQEEMQLAQAWHTIVAFVLMAIIIAHMYIGSVGMEGAYDAMGSGEVDEAWAHQHHSIWLDDVKSKQAAGNESTASAGGAPSTAS